LLNYLVKIIFFSHLLEITSIVDTSFFPTPRTHPTLFTHLRGETVWKFGMGPKSGLRKRPKGVQGVSIGRLLAPNKRSQDAFSYFPNSFGR